MEAGAAKIAAALARTLRIFAALLCLAPSAVSAFDRPDDALRQALQDERLAGITWSTVDNDRIVIGAEGQSNAKTGAGMRPDNRVHVGSITKMMVALGVLRLVTEGRLDLDTPVTRILPEIVFENPWSKSDPVLLRHLLDHTSGLEDARIWQVFSSKANPDTPLLEVFSRDRSVLRLRTRPGSVTSYSNMGYTLAAMVIERITGQRYEHWLDTRLLAPLGMSDSSLAFSTQTGPKADPRLAWGHQRDLSLAAAMPILVRPAGQFTTTAGDMARLARFMMSDGRIGNKSFIRSDLLLAMGRPTGTEAARAGLQTEYALGLAARDREGWVGRCHGGDILGFHAMFCIYAEQKKAFFLAINTDGDGVDLARFDAIMMRSLSLDPHPSATTIKSAEDLSKWRGHYIPLVSRFALERYSDVLTGGLTLRFEGTDLVLDASGKAPRRLFVVGTRKLRAEDRVTTSHVLYQSADGKRVISDGPRSYMRVSHVKIQALWGSLWLGLAGLAYFMLVSPFLAWRGKRTHGQPGTFSVLAFIPAGLLLYLQPFEQLGDLTLASGTLYAATLFLPLAMLGQLVLAIRRHHRFWLIDVAASIAVLQWCIVLIAFGLLPLALWA